MTNAPTCPANLEHVATLDVAYLSLQEFSWRWNKRHMQSWLFDILLREVANGKPLTFKTLTREIF
jgi:hypothetical protein